MNTHQQSFEEVALPRCQQTAEAEFLASLKKIQSNCTDDAKVFLEKFASCRAGRRPFALRLLPKEVIVKTKSRIPVLTPQILFWLGFLFFPVVVMLLGLVIEPTTAPVFLGGLFLVLFGLISGFFYGVGQMAVRFVAGRVSYPFSRVRFYDLQEGAFWEAVNKELTGEGYCMRVRLAAHYPIWFMPPSKEYRWQAFAVPLRRRMWKHFM